MVFIYLQKYFQFNCMMIWVKKMKNKVSFENAFQILEASKENE